MEYAEIISRFQTQSGNENYTESVRTVSAVMETLSERLSPDLSENMANQLPHELKDVTRSFQNREELSLDQFYDRIANRADVSREKIPSFARAVILVLKDALNKGDVDKISESLPDDYLTLFSE